MKSTIYEARIERFKNVNGQCMLKLYLVEIEAYILLDIHDALCETLGISNLSKRTLGKILYALPKYLKVTRINGYWEMLNERQVLSDYLSRISID